MRRRIFLLLALSTALMQSAWAASTISGADGGRAIDGYDPVAYFTEGKAVPGNPGITAEWQGAQWRFASAEHRELFTRTPEKYAPQYGGYCAYAVAHDLVAKGNGERWKIVDDKLYLNNNWVVHKLWLSDVPGNLKDSEANWTNVKAKIERK